VSRPAADDDRSARDRPERLAGVVARLVAWMLDVVVVVLLIVVASAAVGTILGPAVRFGSAGSADPISVDAGRAASNALVSTMLSAAYFVIPWVRFGGSGVQLLLGLEVQSETDGGRLPPGRALARWVLLFPPFGNVAALMAGRPVLAALVWSSALVWYPLLLITTLRSATRQGLHDRVVRSVVRRRPSAQPAAREMPTHVR